MRTLKDLANEAIAVQDACNLVGISQSFAAAMVDLRKALEAEKLPNDTHSIATHPITKLWVDKLVSLSHSDVGISDAYSQVYSLT